MGWSAAAFTVQPGTSIIGPAGGHAGAPNRLRLGDFSARMRALGDGRYETVPRFDSGLVLPSELVVARDRM